MLLFLLEVVLVIIVLLVLHYLVFVWNPNYFKKMGVPGPFPWPLIGYTRHMMKHGVVQADIDLQKYGRVVGVFEGTNPVLLTRDPDIIQQVAIKQFNNFTNRRSFTTGETIFDLQLTGLKDDHWRHVRHLMIPAFSSGKLKLMTSELNKCSKLLIANVEKAMEVNSEVNVKDYCGAFTMDVIARTLFGIEVDSQQNKDNPFVHHAHKTMRLNFFRPAVMIYLFFPALRPLLTVLGTSVYPLDSKTFFSNAIQQIMKGRIDEDNKNCIDFIQLMMNAHKESQLKGDSSQDDPYGAYKSTEKWTGKGLTLEEIEAQAILFFLAGYDTTATTIAFFLHSMATNPECQERLYNEITEMFGDKETFDYDTINDLDYLERCILETLRAYPPAIRVDRIPSEDITVAGLTIPKGLCVCLEIYALHHDPQLWPNPEIFDPERFTKEARQSHHPYQYMPFGAGPRICVGQRLALLEVKIAAASLIRHFCFSACAQTDIPIQFSKTGHLLTPDKGPFLKVERRS